MSYRPWEEALLEHIAKVRTLEIAAPRADVSVQTVKRHMRRDPELRAKVDTARKLYDLAELERRRRRVRAAVAGLPR